MANWLFATRVLSAPACQEPLYIFLPDQIWNERTYENQYNDKLLNSREKSQVESEKSYRPAQPDRNLLDSLHRPSLIAVHDWHPHVGFELNMSRFAIAPHPPNHTPVRADPPLRKIAPGIMRMNPILPIRIARFLVLTVISAPEDFIGRCPSYCEYCNIKERDLRSHISCNHSLLPRCSTPYLSRADE